MTTSATGGYLVPVSTTPLSGVLTLQQFIQTVLVGVSGLPGPMVRPKFQVAPPKQPDVTDNWLAFSVMEDAPDANAYVGMDAAGNTTMQRHSDLDVQCSFYGPRALDYYLLVRDGLSIPQNREKLQIANMGFVESGRAHHLPELVNERWFDRYEAGFRFRREMQRTYPILSITSANGTVSTVVGNEEWIKNWQVPVVL